MEILDKVYETKLCSSDDWSYVVRVYEDTTAIYYKEGKEELKLLCNLTAGYDIQVAEEIIRLRKLKGVE